MVDRVSGAGTGGGRVGKRPNDLEEYFYFQLWILITLVDYIPILKFLQAVFYKQTT